MFELVYDDINDDWMRQAEEGDEPQQRSQREEPKFFACPQSLRHGCARKDSEKCLSTDGAHRQQKNRDDKFHPASRYSERLERSDEASRCPARNTLDNFPAAFGFALCAIAFRSSLRCSQGCRRLRRFTQTKARQNCGLSEYGADLPRVTESCAPHVSAGAADQIFLQRDRVVRVRVHEMISVPVFVTELERFSLDLDQLHFVRRSETDISAFACVDVTNDCLDKRAQVPRRTMMHLEHNGGVAIVFDGYS